MLRACCEGVSGSQLGQSSCNLNIPPTHLLTCPFITQDQLRRVRQAAGTSHQADNTGDTAQHASHYTAWFVGMGEEEEEQEREDEGTACDDGDTEIEELMRAVMGAGGDAAQNEAGLMGLSVVSGAEESVLQEMGGHMPYVFEVRLFECVCVFVTSVFVCNCCCSHTTHE